MAGARIEITQDTATPTIRHAVAALQADAIPLLLDDIGEYLVLATRTRAASEVAPDGTPWAALSPRYKKFKDRKRPGAPKLKFDFHMLGDRLSHQVVGNDLLVGTQAKYGAIQQFGGEITHRRANPAHRVTLPSYKTAIPARPWLGISAEDETEIAAIAQDHLSQLFAVRTS